MDNNSTSSTPGSSNSEGYQRIIKDAVPHTQLPYESTLSFPFPSPRLAEIAKSAIDADPELDRNKVQRDLSVLDHCLVV
ncbi:hypothetical protein EV182_004506, partial [Spiromyces aspiralis]